ncbi:hypothetical protein A9R05_39680 (plasmid) [Burkholderia sp. KK1]|nr:hypothetical protein A9R05_39680 [Burkholderia sp. KK1]
MNMVAAVVMMTGMVIIVGYHRMVVCCPRLLEVLMRRCFVIGHLRGRTNHRDGRKRLNRKAQCQQHDENEFAPVGHRRKV